MNIKYECKKGSYFITINGNKNSKIIAYFLKMPINKYENFLRENGGKLELDGNIYFYNKDIVLNVIKELNKHIK